jgi:ribosomal protein L40E
MVSNESSAGVIKAAVSRDRLLYLLEKAGIKPSKFSPLAGMSGRPASLDFLRELQSSGLTDNANNPTPACREALTILANPASEIDLLWGNPDGVSLSIVYGAAGQATAGQDRFVSFTSVNGSSNIAYFLTTQDIADLMAQKLAFTDIVNITPLDVESVPAAIPVFFAALDIYRESQLRAALERRAEMNVTVTADDLNRITQEAKLENSFSWYAPAAYYAMPLDLTVNEKTAVEGFNALKKAGLIGAGGEFSDSLTALAYRAFPLAAFFGIKLTTLNAGTPEKTQLALFRGLSTLLLVQIEPESGENRVSISSIATAQLAELIFNLGTRSLEAAAPVVPAAVPPAAEPTSAKQVYCSKCGTVNSHAAKFCQKCGAPMAVPAPAPAAVPEFCPKCGDPVTAGEKFCDKCGTALQ